MSLVEEKFTLFTLSIFKVKIWRYEKRSKKGRKFFWKDLRVTTNTFFNYRQNP